MPIANSRGELSRRAPPIRRSARRMRQIQPITKIDTESRDLLTCVHGIFFNLFFFLNSGVAMVRSVRVATSDACQPSSPIKTIDTKKVRTQAVKCAHGRRRNECKECGGSQVCEHGRLRSRCKECGGGSICEHGRMRGQCKECGGRSICEHGRRRSQCKECGGASICSAQAHS